MRYIRLTLGSATVSPACSTHMKFRKLATLACALLMLGWLTPPVRSQANIQAKIQRDGKLPGGPAYQSLVAAKYGIQRRRERSNQIARSSSPGSMLVQVGDQPEGFGKGFIWDRKDDQILLAVFINAADNLGVSIDGIARNDIVTVQSASGIASFSEDTGNPTASSIVGLVGVGAKAAAGIGGYPEALPAIDAAEQFAKDQFKASNAKTKRRDAFGVDPGSGHKAKEEGGVLICLPEAGGPYYSGNSDTKSRWIKPDGTRTDDHLPNHIPIGTAFFPIQGDATQNQRRVNTDGQLYVVPWDWKFEDNAGYYKLFIHIKKGPEPQPWLERRGRQ